MSYSEIFNPGPTLMDKDMQNKPQALIIDDETDICYLLKGILKHKNIDAAYAATIAEGEQLQVGDKLTVRVQLSSDRAMEYIHVKDMRASGTEPADILSGYNWKGGLGYYQSTRDAATNFFISYLPKGSYQFEYNLFINQAGNFSVGVSTAQCLYAPEFSAHSEGLRINVK